MEGFYKRSTTLKMREPQSLVPKCGACGLFKTCQTPKMGYSGSGRKKILVVGEAPGKYEDMEGLQFVGETGRLLQRSLRKFGVDLRKDCWTTNAIICRPPDNVVPNEKVVEWCRPNLMNTIRDLNPCVVVLLGSRALKSLLTPLWKDDVKGVKRWAGFTVPNHHPNAWICPTYHPSFVSREKEKSPLTLTFFERHLQRAVELSEARPWETPPDFKKEVEVTLDVDHAASTIRSMIRKGGAVAFDYETDRLKPDSKDARIVSCSVCWRGKRTIAYPWHGEAIKATKELLASNLPKIASNMKFEERWSLRVLKQPVNNWFWDTMQMAHCIDSRRGVCSIKFQSYVLLGQPDYDYHIKPMLDTGNEGNKPNEIRQVDIRELLLYNGLDSLLEFKVAEIQMRRLGIKMP